MPTKQFLPSPQAMIHALSRPTGRDMYHTISQWPNSHNMYNTLSQLPSTHHVTNHNTYNIVLPTFRRPVRRERSRPPTPAQHQLTNKLDHTTGNKDFCRENVKADPMEYCSVFAGNFKSTNGSGCVKACVDAQVNTKLTDCYHASVHWKGLQGHPVPLTKDTRSSYEKCTGKLF